jgi:hypothetical protein
MTRIYIYFIFAEFPRGLSYFFGSRATNKSTPNLLSRASSSLIRLQTKQNGDAALELRKKKKEMV